MEGAEPVDEFGARIRKRKAPKKKLPKKRKKKSDHERQSSIFDIVRDVIALVVASHDRKRRHGLLLDRLHDLVILLILFVSIVTLAGVAIYAAFGTPVGYFYTEPQKHDLQLEHFKGEALIKGSHSGFSPHNGRFSFKMRMPYNSTWMGLVQDDFTMFVTVRAKKNKDSDWEQVEGLQTNRRALYCTQSDLYTNRLEPDDDGDYHETWFYSDVPACREMTILYDNPSYYTYEVEIRIDAKEEILYTLGLFDGYIETRFAMNSDTYTTFEWILRLVFSIITFFLFTFFIITMFRTQKWGVWTTQQKWLTLLLFELIFYHDPLYVADVYSGWYIFPIIEISLSMTFVFTFLLYLLVFFHSLFKPPKERSFFNFWVSKFFVVVPFYFLTILMFVASRLYDHADPSHDSIRDIDFFFIVMIVCTIFALIYVFLLVYYVFKAIGNVHRMRKSYSSRFKVIGGLSFIVVISFIGLSVSYSVFRFDSPGFQFLVTHTLILMYFSWLTIFFLPSTTIEKKNPKTSISKKQKKKNKRKYRELQDHEDLEDNIGIGGNVVQENNNNNADFNNFNNNNNNIPNVHGGVPGLEIRSGSNMFLDEIQAETPMESVVTEIKDFKDEGENIGSIEMKEIEIDDQSKKELEDKNKGNGVIVDSEDEEL